MISTLFFLSIPFLFFYVLPAVLAAILQWADYRDSPHELNFKEKIIKLYLLPLIPIANWMVVAFAFIEYFS